MKTKKHLGILACVLVLSALICLIGINTFAAENENIPVYFEDNEITLRDEDSDGLYEIDTADKLFAFAYYCNTKGSISAELTAHITIPEGKIWTPIGKKIDDEITNNYIGTFDGAGFTIYGLYYDGDDIYIGLFERIDENGRVNNVKLENVYFHSEHSNFITYVAGIAGYSKGTIQNCTVNGTISGDSVGGIVGYNNGTVQNCYNTGEVSGGDSVGGIVGYNGDTGTVQKCTNSGTVNGTYVGGIVGWNEAYIANCINIGNVSHNGSNDIHSSVGGIVGRNLVDGTVQNCISSDVISEGNLDNIGSIAGYSRGTVQNCYYLDTSANIAIGVIEDNNLVTSVEEKTKEEFASGEVAWLLNGETSDGAFGQYIGRTDSFPVLGGMKVYKNGDTYGNTISPVPEEHTHTYENGFCSCGENEAPEQDENSAYLIKNAGNLYWFAKHVNDGNIQANAKLKKISL